MKRIVAALAVLAVVAAGVSFFVLRDDGSEQSSDETAAGDENAIDLSKRKKPKSERTDRGSRGEVSVLFDDDPVGNLPLEGQVVDRAGVGVGGATVSINSNPPRSATSEADGSFAITKLVGRDYRIVARHESGTAGPIIAKLTDTNEPVILTIKPASSVVVKVVDADASRAISSATVELRGIERLSESTNDDGTATFVSIAPSRYEVVAKAPGYAPQRQRVRVARGAAKVEVELGLKTGASVAGIVLGHDGKPVAGARVVFSGASDWSQRANPRWDAEETGADGKFKFAALPVGSFRFTARAAGRAPGRSELLTLDGTTAKDDVKLMVGEGATLRGRVLTVGGQPVAAAAVRISRSRAGFRGGVREAFANDKGEYEVSGLERAELQAVARSAEAASEPVAIDFTAAPHTRNVDVSLALDGFIAGVVTDADGTELEGVQVSANPDFRSQRGRGRRGRGGFGRRSRALTDAGGRFKITGLSEGAYMLRASRSQRAGWLLEPTMAKVGDTDVVIKLEAEGKIKGKVAFASGDAPSGFSVGLSGWGGGTPFGRKDGSFELDDLSPQTYTLTIRGPGFDSKQLTSVELDAGETKDLGTITVKKGRVLIGTVVDPSGSPVAGALVRAGRSIFGSGTSSSAGRGGPPMARNAKEARTDESGEFAIYGLPGSDVSIVAEHETLGRSVSQLIQNGGASVTEMRLALAPYGSLEGKVTKEGAPAVGVRIGISSIASPDITYGVGTGDDGHFRFDRLAPDDYKVSAMIGRGPMRGFGFQSQKVTVKSGKTETITLALESGELELAIKISEGTGKTLNFTWVTGFAGAIEAKTARELELEIARQPEGYSAQGMAIAGMPATLRNLKSGPFTICGTPYPPEVTGMSATMAYMEREGDNLPTFCKKVELADSPTNQKAQLAVSAPAFVPPPADEGH